MHTRDKQTQATEERLNKRHLNKREAYKKKKNKMNTKQQVKNKNKKKNDKQQEPATSINKHATCNTHQPARRRSKFASQ